MASALGHVSALRHRDVASQEVPVGVVQGLQELFVACQGLRAAAGGSRSHSGSLQAPTGGDELTAPLLRV